MAVSSDTAEVVALVRAFSYLSKSIDAASVIPEALSKGLITQNQMSDCSRCENIYKKAETFLNYLLRTVNGNSRYFHTFAEVLDRIGQESVAAHLRG